MPVRSHLIRLVLAVAVGVGALPGSSAAQRASPTALRVPPAPEATGRAALDSAPAAKRPSYARYAGRGAAIGAGLGLGVGLLIYQNSRRKCPGCSSNQLDVPAGVTVGAMWGFIAGSLVYLSRRAKPAVAAR